MYIYCVDDNPLQLKRAKDVALQACLDNKIGHRAEIRECSDGRQLLDAVKNEPASLILLDINMPVLDGLSTLVKLMRDNPSIKVIMVSSENSSVVTRFKKNTKRSDIDPSKKKELLQKVVDRVKNDREEEGKINSVLEACGNLGLDPIEVAKELGASEFIQKPYEVNEASKILVKYING